MPMSRVTSSRHSESRLFLSENMSRRAAIVEEEFDDDTDLVLPSYPLPNTGTSGPLIQELNISDDEFEPPPNQRAGPASPPHAQPMFRPPTGYTMKDSAVDLSPYKKCGTRFMH
jgi:signal recognition particle subunit SRP19